MKTADQIIHEQIGLTVNAGNNIPMDKGECKRCMEAYIKQAPTEPVEGEWFAKQDIEYMIERHRAVLELLKDKNIHMATAKILADIGLLTALITPEPPHHKGENYAKS